MTDALVERRGTDVEGVTVTADLAALVAAAIRAPSGDNTQPWRFAVDAEAGLIAISVDESRDPSPMNAGQRMSRIACGAAAENIAAAARARGWDAAVGTDGARGIAVSVTGRHDSPASPGSPSARTEAAIAARVTNRRPYDARPMPPDRLAALREAAPELDGVAAHWICGRDRIERLACLIGRADAAMFGEPSMRAAFLNNIRFDAPVRAEVDEGLSLASLEVSALDRMAMRTMRHIPGALLKLGGAMRVFSAHARKLVRSASGLCVIAAKGTSDDSDFAVGRTMERAWLALAAQGLAAQPMMSLPVLANALDHGSAALIASLGRERVSALLDEFRSLAPEMGRDRPAFLLRFGGSAPPSGRTGRLPLAAALASGTGRTAVVG